MALTDADIARHIILDIIDGNAEPMLPEDCCIFKVHDVLRKENEEAFTPYLVSIGPIHRNNEKLQPMEKHKIKYFMHFRQRLPNGQEDLENFTAYVGSEESQIRGYYSETYSELGKREFVHMILLDSVFIMELFLRNWYDGPDETTDDVLFSNSWMKKSIERDLLLIENQIPFFVLKKLFGYVPSGEGTTMPSSCLLLSCCYFETYDPSLQVKNKRDQLKANNRGDQLLLNGRRQQLLKQHWSEPKHFTDLVRYFFIPQGLCYDGVSTPVVKTASKLKESGITFEPMPAACRLDVKFLKRVRVHWLSWFPPLCWLKFLRARLQIPRLIVDGSTESILLNFMALEMLHYPDHHYVCNYAALFDNLIDAEKDVDVLVESRVIEYKQGRNAADLANLFNKICKNIVVRSSYYATLARDLNNHCGRFNSTMAQLRLVYFRDLWRCNRTLVGVAVLAFAITGFIKAIKDLT